MSNYTLEKINNPKNWDVFVAGSTQGSVYSTSGFINSISPYCSYYYVKKGNDVVAGTYVIEDGNGKVLKQTPYTQYKNSILFATVNASNHKLITEQFKITEFIILELVNIYGEFQSTNSPYFNDIRPFQWFNYGLKDKPVFQIINRYTSILERTTSREDYLMQLRSVRRQEIKKAEAIKIIETKDSGILNDLHAITFERQNIVRDLNEEKALLSITDASIKNNFGKLFIAEIENTPVSAVLITYDNKTAYYQFGASNYEYRNTGASTKLLFESILYSFEKLNLQHFDFVGVNSPNRGDYKLSFNGALKPYFELRLS